MMGLGTVNLETRGKRGEGARAASSSTLVFPTPRTVRNKRLLSQAPVYGDFGSELRHDPSPWEMRAGEGTGHTACRGWEPP